MMGLYYRIKELAAAHLNQVRTPESSKHYTGKPFQQVVLDFQNAGFLNVDIEAQKVPKKTWLSKDGLVSAIHIGTETAFEKGAWFSKDSKVTVTYQVFVTQAKAKKGSDKFLKFVRAFFTNG